MSNCLCGSGAKNLGQPNCVGDADRPIKLGFQERLANDGTENGIEKSETLNAAYFQALINQTDKSKRLYPTGVLKSVVNSRADQNTFEADGVAYFVSEGNITYTFDIYEGASPKLAAAYNSMRCKDMMVYNFSLSSQIVGNGSNPNLLKGFRIEKNTLYAKYMPASYTEPSKITVTFTISVLEDDADMAYINYNPTGTGTGVLTTDPLTFEGLIDVTMGAATSITTTGFVIPMTYIYGDLFDPKMFEAGELADFTLYNVTDAAAVTITSVAEVDGLYTFVIPTQTAADVLRPSFSKTGFEATNVITITIPS
jgi:hypothetical protein